MQKRSSLVLRLGLSIMLMSCCTLVLSVVRIAYGLPYVDIDVPTAYSMITSGSYPNLLVLDVRTQSEYDDGHLEGAILIPVAELESRIAELAAYRDDEIIVYCRTGVRSAAASTILDSNNFAKVFNMLGGITAWESAGYSICARAFGSATALFANPLVWIQSVIILVLLAIIAVLIRRSRSRENKRVEASAQLC